MSRLVEQLERTDPSTLDAAGVATSMRDVRRLRGFITEVEHAVARHANQLAAAGSGAPATEMLSASGNCSPREAARTSRRAETLGTLPAVTRQLSTGRIGTEHADAIATAASRLDDDTRSALVGFDTELAQAAAASTPGQFKRFLDRMLDQLDADRGLDAQLANGSPPPFAKGINEKTGMYWLRGEFDPESGTRLFRAIDAEARSLAAQPGNEGSERHQLAAHALVELATSANRSRRPGRSEILALVDLGTITTGLHEASICELDDGTTLPSKHFDAWRAMRTSSRPC